MSRRLRTPTLARPDILPEPEAGTLVFVVGDGQEYHCKPWPAIVSAVDFENRPVEWPPPAAADGARVYELNYVANPCQDPILNSSGRILAFRDNYHRVVNTDIFWKSKVPGWDAALREALFIHAKEKDESEATAISFGNVRSQVKLYEKMLAFGAVPSFDDTPQRLATKKKGAKAPAKKKAPAKPPPPVDDEDVESEPEAAPPAPAPPAKKSPPKAKQAKAPPKAPVAAAPSAGELRDAALAAARAGKG